MEKQRKVAGHLKRNDINMLGWSYTPLQYGHSLFFQPWVMEEVRSTRF